MPASVKFLERLVPSAGAHGGAVRAALPTRFAPRSELPETHEMVEGSRADAPRAAGDAAGPQGPRGERGEPVVHVETQQVTQQLSTPPAMAVLDAGRVRTAEAEAPLSKAAAAPEKRDAMRPAPTLRAARGNVEAVAPEATPPRRDAEPPLRPMMMPLASVARPSGEVRPPLRESTVSQRTSAPRGETPAVVHVTIDRVDVRTPGLAAAQSRLTPKPRASGTVSLNDYLKQRDRTRNGGHS